jgi:hypothetical protein
MDGGVLPLGGFGEAVAVQRGLHVFHHPVQAG